MVLFLVALLAMAQPAAPLPPEVLGQANWIFSTVGPSEWCAPGNVRLDLRTGRYVLTVRTPRARCDKPDLERPVRTGTLPVARLALVRAASRRVVAEGLRSADCRDGRRPADLVIGNDHASLLALTTASGVAWTPDDHSCWSAAAIALQATLDDAFATREWR